MPFPLLGAVAIGAGANLAGGIIGHFLGKGDRDTANRILEEAQRKYGNIDPPTLERVAAEVLGPTAMAQIQADPQYQAAQRSALDRLGGVLDAGGYTVEDRAMENAALNRSMRADAVSRNRVYEDMAARGTGGSGAELAMLMANSQDSSQRNSEVGLNAAAQAQRRYLDTILSQGQMAGQFRSQDFSEQARKAEAQDAISRYNADAINKSKYYNAGLGQQQFNNQLAITDRQYGAAQDRANVLTKNAAQSQATWGQAGQAVGAGATNLAAYYAMGSKDEDDDKKTGGMP